LSRNRDSVDLPEEESPQIKKMNSNRESLDLEEFEYEDPTAQSQTGKNL